MLIEFYELEVFTPPCKPGAERYSAIARLQVDISEALPYLNAMLLGALYMPEAAALGWQRGGHKVVFAAHQIAISNVQDRDEAIRQLAAEVERVNHVWERRASIEPSTRARQPLTPLAIYRLLPKTNCRACGEPTCYVFAAKLAATQVELAGCPVVQTAEYSRQFAALQELVEGFQE